MSSHLRSLRILAALLCSLSPAVTFAAELANPDFELGAPGQAPDGWRVPPPIREAGYRVTITTEGAANGSACVMLEKAVDAPKSEGFGNVLQSVKAELLRGKRVRFSGSVRVDPAEGGHALLWMRVDRKAAPGGPPQMGFFDNMADRPIRASDWKRYEIIGDVAEDATQVTVGCMLIRSGRAWFDNAKFEILGEPERAIAEPPRPLSDQGLTNVVAFARLLGYVRYFHPSDDSVATDWEAFAADGVRAVEGSADSTALLREFNRLFQPIAPSVQISLAREKQIDPPAPPSEGTVKVWQHTGLGTEGNSAGIYASQRVVQPLAGASEKDLLRLAPFTADLGGGIACLVPVCVPFDERGTIPEGQRTKPAAPALPTPTQAVVLPTDRGTRMAGVILAWNVLQHSYPYFDVAEVDWPTELKTGLQRAATDPDAIAFLGTLRCLLAALRDGHGSVSYTGDARGHAPGFRAEWIEKQLVVTEVLPGPATKAEIARGDAILAVDRRPVAEALAASEAQISGATPQWIRHRGAYEVFSGARDAMVEIELEPFAAPGTRRTITLPRDTKMAALLRRRGESLTEVEPGIFYLDIDRLKSAEFLAAIPKLENAQGLIFDFRGYPAGMSPLKLFQHLTETPLTSPQWHTPQIYRPDRSDITFLRSGEWTITPKAPYLRAKRIFLTDGRAISYAESCLGIVEHYRLGEVIGGPTAGTNGNINRMSLPGGYSMVWTGMKVLKHDGSQHHAVGIRPTIPAEPTRSAAAIGRDEVLQKAIEVLKK